jgi:hypothetical protein
MGQTKGGVGVTDGFRRRSAGKGGNTMGQSFLSGNQYDATGGNAPGAGAFMPPHNESIYSANMIQKQTSHGFGGNAHDNATTSSAFKKRTTSVSKPVDRDLMDQFKAICDSCNQQDWQKRLRAIDDIQEWVEKYSKRVQSAQTGTFITLIDTYCQLIQDNNAKVQSRAQQSLEVVMGNPDLHPLVNSNLTMLI